MDNEKAKITSLGNIEEKKQEGAFSFGDEAPTKAVQSTPTNFRFGDGQTARSIQDGVDYNNDNINYPNNEKPISKEELDEVLKRATTIDVDAEVKKKGPRL